MFDAGAFASGLITGLREGVEAALIVSIVLAYLARTGNTRYVGRVWLGVGVAVVASLIAGAVIFGTVRELEAPYEQAFEGVMMLIAAGVVTWMLFWMRRQASSVKGELQRAVDQVLTQGTTLGLVALAFTAVIREGIETSLFLVGQAAAVSGGEDPAAAASLLLGALAGIALAVVLGWGFYRGSRRINLARFFRWTGILLVFIAAGLVSHAVHEFIEIGVISFGTTTAWDLSGTLSDASGVGLFLRALFGYSATPELATVVAWLLYVVVVLALYLRPLKPAPIARRDRQVAST